MIIPGLISVAEIIDSPRFSGFRSDAPDGGRSLAIPSRTSWRGLSVTQPSPERQAAPARRAGAEKKTGKERFQRFVMMKCDLRFEAYAVSFWPLSNGCSSPTVVTVI